MLHFNTQGLLVPNNNIKSDVIELETVFVNGIGTAKRKGLFDKYVSYSKSLKSICGESDLLQWIDGSFATKKLDPQDIDLVTFIDHLVVDKLNGGLDNYKYPASKNVFGVDAYIVKVYPPNHKNYILFQADWAYWMNHFNSTRRNRIGNKSKKGFLELKL